MHTRYLDIIPPAKTRYHILIAETAPWNRDMEFEILDALKFETLHMDDTTVPSYR